MLPAYRFVSLAHDDVILTNHLTTIKASQLMYSGNLQQSNTLRPAVESAIDKQPGKFITATLFI